MGTKEEQIYFYNMFDEMWPKDHVDEIDLAKEVEDLEKNKIEIAMKACSMNQTRAAKKLGLGRTNLIAKLKKYEIIF